MSVYLRIEEECITLSYHIICFTSIFRKLPTNEFECHKFDSSVFSWVCEFTDYIGVCGFIRNKICKFFIAGVLYPWVQREKGRVLVECLFPSDFIFHPHSKLRKDQTSHHPVSGINLGRLMHNRGQVVECWALCSRVFTCSIHNKFPVLPRQVLMPKCISNFRLLDYDRGTKNQNLLLRTRFTLSK